MNTAQSPAPAGRVVTVYLTGIGPVANQPATGAAASLTALSRATLPVAAVHT